MDGVPSGVPREGHLGKYSLARDHVKPKMTIYANLAVTLVNGAEKTVLEYAIKTAFR